MPELYTVFAAIAGEREYQEQRWKHTCAVENKPYKPDSQKSVAEYLSYIAGYNVDLLHAVSHVAGPQASLDVFRKLAALCVACMEANGACPRQLDTGTPGFYEDGPLPQKQVFRMIETERQYQDQLGADRTDSHQHSVSGYVVMFQHYLHKAHEQWTVNPGYEYAVDVIRKLAGIAVHAMEHHGIILREPFEA